MYRGKSGGLEVFLVHPGGPFFARKDEGSWTIPKGLTEENEDYLATALREFKEETGVEIPPASELIPLGSIKQKGGKTVHAWAVESDLPEGYTCVSNTFRCEWPPKSGKFNSFPEIDKAQFFPLAEAKTKINPAQVAFLERLESLV